MNDTLIDFRDSLRNGMGLWEALEEYNLTLKEAMDHIDKPMTRSKRKRRSYEGMGRFIYRMGNYYVIQKSIRNKTVNFGTYNRLSDAKKVRDYYLEHGWNRKTLNKVCEELGVTRRRK